MTYDEMRVRQAWPYEVKIKHAEKVAREFMEKVSAGIEYGGEHGDKYRAWNYHISVGGLDSITLLLFLMHKENGGTALRYTGTLSYFCFDHQPHWQHESTGLIVTHWMPLPQPPKGE